MSKRNMMEWFEEKWDCSITKNRKEFLKLVRFYGVDKTWFWFNLNRERYGITLNNPIDIELEPEVVAFETTWVDNPNGYGRTTEITTFTGPISKEVLDYLFPDKEV